MFAEAGVRMGRGAPASRGKDYRNPAAQARRPDGVSSARKRSGGIKSPCDRDETKAGGGGKGCAYPRASQAFGV